MSASVSAVAPSFPPSPNGRMFWPSPVHSVAGVVCLLLRVSVVLSAAAQCCWPP